MSGRMARSTRAPGFLAVSLVVLPIGAKVAEACECSDNPPCAAVSKADAVFVGTVVETLPEPLGGTLSWTVHTIAVNQRLHGSVESSPSGNVHEFTKTDGNGSGTIAFVDPPREGVILSIR
jgi:hypothetical protein